MGLVLPPHLSSLVVTTAFFLPSHTPPCQITPPYNAAEPEHGCAGSHYTFVQVGSPPGAEPHKFIPLSPDNARDHVLQIKPVATALVTPLWAHYRNPVNEVLSTPVTE